MRTSFPTVSRSFSTEDSVTFSIVYERSRTREGQTQTLFTEVEVSIMFRRRTGVPTSQPCSYGPPGQKYVTRLYEQEPVVLTHMNVTIIILVQPVKKSEDHRTNPRPSPPLTEPSIRPRAQRPFSHTTLVTVIVINLLRNPELTGTTTVTDTKPRWRVLGSPSREFN